MNDQELRLECLKLALILGDASDITQRADDLYGFVTGKPSVITPQQAVDTLSAIVGAENNRVR